MRTMPIEDPSCLVSVGFFPEDYKAPVIKSAPLTPSFDTARVGAVAEDPGCLSSLNVMINIPAADPSVPTDPSLKEQIPRSVFEAAAREDGCDGVSSTDAVARYILDKVARESTAELALA